MLNYGRRADVTPSDNIPDRRGIALFIKEFADEVQDAQSSTGDAGHYRLHDTLVLETSVSWILAERQ
ncbi:MAG: hypothetical protein Q7J06_04255 [Bacteroidales bacterium]|nr:hypothetical protein [Bacteroidales bacterium]